MLDETFYNNAAHAPKENNDFREKFLRRYKEKYGGKTMTEGKGLNTWIDTEKTKIDQEREKMKEEKGWNDWFRWEEGVRHEFIILNDAKTPPREHEGKFGLRKVFVVMTQDGKNWDLEVNPKTEWYRVLIKNLSEGNNQLAVIRTGTGKETRYVVKSAKRYDDRIEAQV